MLCPFCLTNLKPHASLCPYCQRQLPSEYVTYHSGLLARFTQPAIVSVIGFSGHGKTVYLASLYYALQNLMPRAWAAFYRQGLTMETLKVLYQNLSMLKRGELPDSTQLVFPEPNIDRLNKIPRFGNRTLLVYDPPGEAFDLTEDDSLQRFAGFVKYSRCALFLVSLNDMMKEFEEADVDLQGAVADEMYRLLERYNVGMKKMGAPDRFQHLIVVYTKADCLLSDFGLPDQIKTYLENPEVETLRDVQAYLRVMRQNSALLRDFTSQELNAVGFLSNAKDHFKSVEFCAVSALGSEPKGQRLTERIAPRRVMDPLLWVLEKS
jgi:hypothetical protein